MNPHARSAAARCWSPPAGEGVLLVLSLARMRYGSPVMPWIGRYYAFYFWWLVTGDSWLGSHLSSGHWPVCEKIVDTVLAPYPTLISGWEDEVYKRDCFFLHPPDSFKDKRADLVLMDSETALSSSGFITPLYIKTEKWGKRRTFWRLEFHYFELVVGCRLLIVRFMLRVLSIQFARIRSSIGLRFGG